MRNLEITLSLGLCLALATAGCKEDKNEEEDTAVDSEVDTPEDTTADTPEDTPEDTTTDSPEDVPGDGECPPDDTTHIYINVAGQVQHMAGGDVDGLYVAAISPVDALTNPAPTPIGTDVTATDGTFAMPCINVAEVALGLVILVDDNPADGVAGDLFPTGTGVKAWTLPVEKVDVLDATPFAVPNALVAGLEAAITGLDAETNGMAMGLVVDGTTHAPIDAAAVTVTSGAAVPVAYPNATMTGLETDSNTSANGSFVITVPLTTIRVFTATATGYTFGTHQAATKAGFIYFMIMAGTSG